MIWETGMNPEKYDRNIELTCPVCGNTQFEFDEATVEEGTPIKCISCGEETTKDQLLRDNAENVDEHVHEVQREVMDDISKEIKKSFKSLQKK